MLLPLPGIYPSPSSGRRDSERPVNWATAHLPEFVEPPHTERSFDSKLHYEDEDRKAERAAAPKL